jgi:cyclase
VKSAEQAKRIIGLGAEKVAISSAAIENSSLITEIANAIGSQSVVVVIDAKMRLPGGHEVWTHNGRTNTGKAVVDFARRVAELGAGEVVVNSIDNDGTMAGYDLALARKVREVIRLPLSILGGAGSLSDIGKLIAECGVVGASAGSLFVFKGPYRAVLISYPTPGEKDDLIRANLALAS